MPGKQIGIHARVAHHELKFGYNGILLFFGIVVTVVFNVGIFGIVVKVAILAIVDCKLSNYISLLSHVQTFCT